MELKKVPVDNPEQLNLILGQSHFIKTVEDLYEAIVGTVPGAKFGLAFCEASDVCLVRHAGTDDELIALAQKNALSIGAGHSFIIFLRDMFPVNILNAIRTVPEVCRIFGAKANPVEVIVAESQMGRGIMGVIDGFAPKGVEGEDDIARRKSFLRAIGYKL
jgi:adenosine/AMP kinase